RPWTTNAAENPLSRCACRRRDGRPERRPSAAPRGARRELLRTSGFGIGAVCAALPEGPSRRLSRPHEQGLPGDLRSRGIRVLALPGAGRRLAVPARLRLHTRPREIASKGSAGTDRLSRQPWIWNSFFAAPSNRVQAIST